MTLPERFKERTAALLGSDEAEKLFRAIEGGEAVKAFRVNRIKTDIDGFEASQPRIDRERAAFPPDAYLTKEEFPGSLPEHHSGAIYMQDISAMSTVHAVKLEKGAKVLDSCSAPGGKTTQLAAAVGDGGIVVANEYDRKRCSILRSNVERMGCKNTVICNLDTAVLAETYPETFDLVLCDAPCSGEGMFRKNERAVDEWSEENVLMCAERQKEILGNVAKCVKAGGKLLYSTCTFAIEENELNVKWFLETHGDFRLVGVEPELHENTSDGINVKDCDVDMTLCRRIYPHRSMGEGQFIAVFERSIEDSQKASPRGEQLGQALVAPFASKTRITTTAERLMRGRRRGENAENKKSRAEAEALAAARDFLSKNLEKIPDGELMMLGEQMFLCPRINLPPYSTVAAGICIGEYQKGRIIPHHQLFSACGRDFKLKIELSGAQEECVAYLHGEEIEAVGLDFGAVGFCAVIIDGCAVGGGKVSGGRCKNHYPKGLRE